MTLGKKENLKYLGILEADNTKYAEIKGKSETRTSHECRVTWYATERGKGRAILLPFSV